MASFLGSIFGFEFGARIYLFWHLWQVIPDWLVLDATGCEQSELLLLCCGSTSMIPAASLWNKFSCHRLLHDGVSMSWHMLLTSRLQDDAAELQRYFQVSPKLLGFGEACFGVLKVSCCGVASWGFTKFGDKRVNDWDLLSGYVVGVACLHRKNPCRRICMQLAPRTSLLIICSLTCRFCLQCFVPLPSAVFSYVQTPNKPC